LDIFQVLRFNSSNRRPVRNYFSQREQWRLLMLIVPLGLVILLMRQLRDSENSARINRFFAEEQNTEQQEALASAGEPPSASSRVDGVHGSGRYFPGVRRELLKVVEDNTYFRNGEKEAWFHLFGILNNTPATGIAAASTAEVGYVELAEQPHVYRGRLVTVRGAVRQVAEQTPAENELGIGSYYRVVIQPTNGSDWPIFVYCLHLPEGVSVGSNSGAVAATGFFFKNLSYRHQAGLGIAPVLLARQIELISEAAGSGASPIRLPAAEEAWSSEEPLTSNAAVSGQPFHEVLALAGWDASRLAQFSDDGPLTDDERREALDLLWRLRRFSPDNLEEWVDSEPSATQVLANLNEDRGKLVRLSGRVKRVARHMLPPNDAARLEMPEYFESELELDNAAGTATILTHHVPRAWLEMPKLDESAAAIALRLKRLPTSGDSQSALFVTSGIAWHPSDANEPYASFGESVLGKHGMDVGLLDDVQNHLPVRAEEREAFYQMLDAAGQIDPSQLILAAQSHLQEYGRAWSRGQQASDPQGRLLAQAIVEKAGEGRYSVAPLFNDAENQVGQLFVFDGVARRIARIDVDVTPDGGPSDVFQRFGIHHYYEIEVFTEDSQNRPLVFCVRELPPGLSASSNVDVPVRIAGFFFKSWRYRVRDTAKAQDTDEVADASSRATIAPLLIGSGPVLLKQEEGTGTIVGLIGGGVVLLSIAGMLAAVWWWDRADRRHHRERFAEEFSLPPGASLDNLQFPDKSQPTLPQGESASGTVDLR
jgi:hypothetical protein